MSSFAERLTAATRRLGAPLCVGLDPFAQRIPTFLGTTGSISALEAFSVEILRMAAARAAALKPQLGLFEAYGPEGYALCRRVCQEARALNVVTILDAKRGDIGTTAEGYAASALTSAGFDADAVTVNPYMGFDTLEPFLATAARAGRGVAVLARTSNPGAGDLQDLECGGRPIWAHVIAGLRPAAARLRGDGPYSSLMIVLGATAPAQARAARALLPEALALVPGFGAQGASAADAVSGLAPGPTGPEGGVINASRAVLYSPEAERAGSLAAWRTAIAEAMDAARAALAAAGGAAGQDKAES